MMKAFLAAALLFTAVQASSATLEVATGDWSNIPFIKPRSFLLISPEAVERVHEVLKKSDCKIPGQSKKWLDLNVPFLLHYGPDGQVDRLVLRRLGCEQVESVLGSVLLKLAEKEQYRATGENAAGWYRSEFNLSSS
jgi:hypothetical protein